MLNVVFHAVGTCKADWEIDSNKRIGNRSQTKKRTIWQVLPLASLENILLWQELQLFFPVNVILNPYYSLAMFLLCSRYVKHARCTHTAAIPEWRTQCTRGVIYYTELTIPRTITASPSNRLKMAPHSVYTHKHTGSRRCVCILVIQALVTVRTRPPVLILSRYSSVNMDTEASHILSICISSVFSLSWGLLRRQMNPKAKLWNTNT